MLRQQVVQGLSRLLRDQTPAAGLVAQAYTQLRRQSGQAG